MKKFKFPLQKLLELRKIKEDLAQKDYAEVAIAILDEEQCLSNLQNQLTESRAMANQHEMRGGPVLSELIQISAFNIGQALRIKSQKDKIENLRKLAELKREILMQSSRDHKVIDKLKNTKKNDYIIELNKEEQSSADEQTLLRYRFTAKE